MIVGVGCDLVDSRRIEKLTNKYSNRFINRILSKAEIVIYNSLVCNENKKNSFLAKRFAAKEAVSKALGIGIGRGLSFCDISITNNSSGAPIVAINKNFGHQEIDYKIQLSLSDEWPMALAFVVISI